MKHTDSGIALEALELSFAIGPMAIVNSLTLRLTPGHVMGLIGPNGAGKTTAIDLLSGFQAAHEGRVLLNGRDVTRCRPYRRAAFGLSRTFQESPAIQGLTVREHLQLAARCARTASVSTVRSVGRLLETFNLRAVADMAASALPTGPRRLVDLARAVAGCPSVLLLDEPYSGLSAPECALVTGQIVTMKNEGRSVVVVEHRLSLLRDVADSVLVLVRGSAVARGTLDEVLSTPEVRSAYLGHKAPSEVKP